jgi:hypothetical protein
LINPLKMSFIDRRISVKRAITLLAKHGIQVDDDEAAVILNFLYLVAKTYQCDSNLGAVNLNEKSNYRKIV